MKTAKPKRVAAAGPDVWDTRPWCEQFGCGVSTFFTLQPPPLSAKVGKFRKIIESPVDYVRRVAKLQSATGG